MKAVALLLILVAAGCVQSLIYEDVLEAEFESFKVEHERSYEDSSEEQLRKLIFKDNKQLIDEHNKRYAAGEETYSMAVNQFTDLLATEFKETMLSHLNVSEFAESIELTYKPAKVESPSEIDWRTKQAVTAVKNQGSCGSCWAFAAAGTLESQHFIKTKQLVPLSEQNLLDCSGRYGNHGCRGGWPAAALMYVLDNHGIDTEEAYPYEGHEGQCRFKSGSVGATVKRVAQVHPDESTLKAAVVKYGPISVAVDATNFQNYRSGVFNDQNCHRQVNHAMLLVGYGHDQSGGDFWLIKNSWGTRWGEQGYMRLARNQGNLCSIASYCFLPLV